MVTFCGTLKEIYWWYLYEAKIEILMENSRQQMKQILNQLLASFFHISSWVSNWIKTKFWSRHTINFVQDGNCYSQCRSTSFLLQRRTKNSTRSSVSDVVTPTDFSSVPSIPLRTCGIFLTLSITPFSLTNLVSQHLNLKVWFLWDHASSC